MFGVTQWEQAPAHGGRDQTHPESPAHQAEVRTKARRRRHLNQKHKRRLKKL